MLGLEIFRKLSENTHKRKPIFPIFVEAAGEPMKEKVKDLSEYIDLNTSITIEVKKGDYKGTYSSRVEDISKNSIIISHPTDSGRPVPMRPDTPVAVEFITKNGRFNFSSNVLGKSSEGSLSFINIEIPETITRQQLREFFRVQTRVKGKVKIYYSKVPDRTLRIPHKSFDCVVVDISGGGGKLVTEAWIDKNQKFGLDIPEITDESEVINCIAVRSQRIQERSEVSFKFDFKRDSERNPIIKYVFKRQIEIKQMTGEE